MSGYEDYSDNRLHREDYPYFTDEEFHTFSEWGKDVLKKLHLSCKKRYETRIANYSLDHDEGMNLEMDLDIVLLGKTCSGKSSTANTILGRKAFSVASSSNSVTKVSLDNTCTYRNRRITVVDTPGIYDTDIDNATVAKELARKAFLLKDGVHCFIICISASDTRFTKDLVDMLELIKQDGRDNFYNYCMLTYTKAETELEMCTLGEFLKEKEKNDSNRRLLENINYRVVAVNNKCLVLAEAIRNRGALIKMVDVVVAENIQNGHPAKFTNDLFKAASSLQEKITSVVKDNSFHQVLVNATIEELINNTSARLSADEFLKGVTSILRKRENSEKNPDVIITGTDRVHDKYVNQIHKIYSEIQPELHRSWGNVGFIALAATAVAVTATAATGGGAAVVAGALSAIGGGGAVGPLVPLAAGAGSAIGGGGAIVGVGAGLVAVAAAAGAAALSRLSDYLNDRTTK